MSVQERRERDRARRHALIIAAARELAEAEGWDAVTTRRLADRVEYSQPVLYGHFSGKAAIVRAVAIEGFTELSAALRRARTEARSPQTALRALAAAYLDFAQGRPALYDAMFVIPTDMPFGGTEMPGPAQAAFAELVSALAPVAQDRDVETLAEVAWCALHGLATLTRGDRLRVSHDQARLDLLIDQLTAEPGHEPGPDSAHTSGQPNQD